MPDPYVKEGRFYDSTPEFCTGEHHQTLLDEETCLWCGRHPDQEHADRLAREASEHIGLMLLDFAIEQTRAEMRRTGRFDHLYSPN